MRVVHENLRAAVHADAFKAAFGSGKLFQRRKRCAGITAGRNGKPGGDKCILDLEFTDQRQAHLKTFSSVFEPQRLRKSIDGGLYETNSRSIASDRHDREAARDGCGDHLVRVLVIDIDDRRGAGREQVLEQPQLGGEIGVECWMIVEMIARDIGEAGGCDTQTVEPVLVEAVR